MTPRTLGVLTVSPSDSGGGAERVALALHEAYRARGLDSWVALGNNTRHLPGTFQIPNDEPRSAWARSLLVPAWKLASRSDRASQLASRLLRVAAEPRRYSAVLSGHEDFEFPASAGILDLPPRRPDVLHLHNLHGSYFDIRALPSLTRQVPTIATMHDAWLITGHCAHPLDCERWRSGCGDCPYLETYVPLRRDASAENREVKREAIAGSRLRVATPSKWLMRLVEASDIADSLVETRVVPNGVDTQIFSPGDRVGARKRLGLPQDRRIVLVAAWSVTDNPFKDYPTLAAALPEVARRHPDVMLVALGAGAGVPSIDGVEITAVPFFSDPERMADYYRAADVYAHPAKAENLPLGVIEAMASGVPVVASEVGGVPEAVVHESTGLLVPPRDIAAMSAALDALLTDEAMRRTMGETGRARALDCFRFESQVDAYMEWYADLVG